MDNPLPSKERVPTTHELKCWPEYFGPVAAGIKRFEIREDDRGYGVGDLLRLREWRWLDEQYTGREVTVRVTYITAWAQEGKHLVMGIEPYSADEPFPALDDSHYGDLTGEELARRAGFASVRDLLSGYKTLVRERTSQPPVPVRRCHHAFDVLVITTAYESGFGHGQNLDGLPNPYSEGSPEHHAYSIGYEEGERKRRTNGSSGYCNQGAHEKCTNLRQNCMCKCHSPTKGVASD